MNLNKLRNQFQTELVNNQTPKEAIEFLINNMDTMLWVDYLYHHPTKPRTIAEMFDDAEFFDYIHEQCISPVPFSHMLADEEK